MTDDIKQATERQRRQNYEAYKAEYQPTTPAPAEADDLRGLAEYLPACSYAIHQAADTIDRLTAEVKRLRVDQQDWRKGVEYIAAALGESKPPDLCCVRIAEKALHIRAALEAADELAELVERWVERMSDDVNREGCSLERMDTNDCDAALTRYRAARGGEVMLRTCEYCAGTGRITYPGQPDYKCPCPSCGGGGVRHAPDPPPQEIHPMENYPRKYQEYPLGGWIDGRT